MCLSGAPAIKASRGSRQLQMNDANPAITMWTLDAT